MSEDNRESEADELTAKIKRDKLRRQRQLEEEEEEENNKRRTSRSETEEAGDNPENEKREEEERKQREKEEQEENENDDENNDDGQDNDNNIDEGQNEENNDNQNSEDKDSKDRNDAEESKDEQEKQKNDNKKEDSEKKNDKESKNNNSKKEDAKGKNSNDGKVSSNKNPSSNNQKLNLNKPGGQNPGANIGKQAGKETGKQASKEASKKAAKEASKQAGKAAAKAGTKAALGPVLFWAIIIILIIIVVVGILFFFICMPGMVVGKIGDAINSFFSSVGDFFDGSDQAVSMVTKEEVVKAARYVENMGYDLQGYGFLSEEVESKVSGQVEDGWSDNLSEWWHDNDSVLVAAKDKDKNEDKDYEDEESKKLNINKFTNEDYKTRQAKTDDEDEEPSIREVYLSKKYDDIENADEDDVREHIVMLKDKDGQVEYAKSKYLAMYIAAENAGYLVRNDNTSLLNRYLKVSAARPLISNNVDNGSGMITFINAEDRKVSDYIKNADKYDYNGEKLKFADPEGLLGINKYKIDRDTKTLIIDNAGDGIFKSSQYTYNLDKYILPYATPIQLSLALHLSSMAPDFAFNVAKSSATDTQVHIGLVETNGNSIKMKLLLDLGDGEKMYNLEEDWAIRTHKDRASGEEEEYDDKKTAIQNSEIETIKNNKKEELEGEEREKEYDKKATGGKTVEQAIDELEDSLKDKTDNNKVQFGHIAYWLDEDQETAYTKSNDESDEGWNCAESYYTEIDKSEELTKIIAVLTQYDLAETKTNSEGKSTIKIKDKEDKNVKRIKQLFIDHFKNGDVIDNVREYYSKSDQDAGKYMPDCSNWRSWKKYTGFGDKGDDKADPDGPNIDLIDNNVEIYCAKDDEGDYNQDSDFYIPGVLYVVDGVKNCDYWWQMRIEDIWSWFFEDVKLKNLDHWYDVITDGISKHIPTRYYYRLVEADTGDVVNFDLKDDKDFVYYDDMNTYYIDNKDGWFWRKAIPLKLYNAIMKKEGNEEAADYTKADSDKVTEVYQLLCEADDTTTEDYTRYVPIILDVVGHWYEDLDFKGCYQFMEDEDSKLNEYEYTAKDNDTEGVISASNAGIVYKEEKTLGSIKQIAEPKKIKNNKLETLLKEEYYIYDGVERSDEKKKINFKDSAVDAIAMLEQIEGESAQHIIRMFKEFMLTQGIAFEETQATDLKKELFSKVIKDYDATDKLLTDNESDTVIRANLPPTQEGFDKDLVVQAPIAGKITYRTDDSVCILINVPGKKYDKYTILISGFAVNKDIVANETIVQEGTELGKTIKQDLKLLLRDENGAIIKNEYVAMDVEEIKGKEIKCQVPGKVIAKNDDGITILIENPGKENDGYTMTISGMDINSNLKVGDKISVDSVIGKATGKTISLTVVDKDNILVKKENGVVLVNDYIKADVDIKKTIVTGSGVNSNISASANGKRTATDLEKAIDQYNINSTAKSNWRQCINEFLQVQDQYDIDPLFIMAVTITESTAGTGWDLIDSSTNNWFSITYWRGHNQGTYTDRNGTNWCKYNSLGDAVLGFGNYLTNSGHYDGKITIESIGKVYCDPPTDWIKATSGTYQQLKNCLK